MFARFRQTARSLQVSIVETRRIDGGVRHEHIAGLGSIPVPQAVAARIEFWTQLQQTLARLSNRIGADDQGKILTAVHARIPMPTLDERRVLQIQNADADVRFWSELQDMQQEQSVAKKELAETVTRQAVEHGKEADNAREKAEAARQRLARLKSGEDLAGGTGKQLSHKEMVAIIGGPAAARRALKVAVIYEAGAKKQMLDEQAKRAERIENRVINEFYRRHVRGG
jgi:hypothetical protein